MDTASNNSAQTNDLLRQVRAASETVSTASMRERIDQLFLVCRDAAELEQMKLKQGRPLPPPAPWPKSTWDFLRREAKKHHE